MTIDIGDFFTVDNEKQGIWYEPVNCGIEFKILGISSDRSVTASEQYEKDLAHAEKESDPMKRKELEKEALIRRIGAVITDVRGKDGNEILMQGKPLSFSEGNINNILSSSTIIRDALLKGISTKSNFMTKKH